MKKKETAKIVAIACLVMMLFACLPVKAQVDSWRMYMSYYEPQQIVKANNLLFVRASNGLYSYNLNDQSITTYDKVTGLNDTYISFIAWNQKVKRLIIVYKDANIDVLDTDNNIINISSLYSKSMTQDKTINGVYIYEQHAFIATGFGIVKVNMERAEISESYILDYNVNAVTVSNGNIYARKSDGSVMAATLSKNLIDKSNWQAAAEYPSFDEDRTDWNNYYATVATLKPGGPKYNDFGFLRFYQGKVYGVANSMEVKGSVQVYDGNEWSIYEDDLESTINHRFVGLNAVDIDPLDETHVMVGGQTGIYEYKNGKFVKEYTNDNSPLKTAQTVGGDNKEYVIVTDVKYDKQGNLWCLNSISPSTSLLVLTKDGKWVNCHSQKLMIPEGRSMEDMRSMIFDSDNRLWFGNNYYRTPALITYDVDKNVVDTYTSFINQDGTNVSVSSVRCVVEDLENNLWIGTNAGPLMFERSNINADNAVFTQVKVPRNDGTNYADYLLSGVEVNCIAIDGANRKWIGTNGNGLYLISADNLTQLQHFTTENSSILSDIVRAVVINGTTGEVFIGTENGLCSYIADATTASIEMTDDNVYAYPNPVQPGYDGMITVVGLSYNADVKILSVSGKLIVQGRSNGGTFTWNGCDQNGHRVASGIYMVATATNDGNKGTVCKIAIVR